MSGGLPVGTGEEPQEKSLAFLLSAVACCIRFNAHCAVRLISDMIQGEFTGTKYAVLP
jgi:hypothetical protein